MSFNILCSKFTPERIELVLKMVEKYAPDTIGFQEPTVKWMETLNERLGDRYAFVGVGRNADGGGEASPVFFRKSRFELLDSGTEWMTSTPDVPGSKIEESSLPRVYSYALLRERETGKELVHINTHLEHTTEEARRIQAGYLVDFIGRYLKEKNAHCVLTGDFNCQSNAESYAVVKTSGLNNATEAAERSEPAPTFHGFGKVAVTIDYIFTSPEIKVEFCRVCDETFTDENGEIAYPSDHNPVIADCVI